MGEIIRRSFQSPRCITTEGILWWYLIIIILSSSQTETSSDLILHSNCGISLSVQGTLIMNNGFVDIDDIGEENSTSQLICHTDKDDCCRNASGEVLGGDWYFPNGERVGNNGSSDSFATNRGHSQILLFRNGFPSQRGRFHCEIANASNDNQTVYVNILNIDPVTISPSSPIVSQTARENFILNCSTTIMPQIDIPTSSFEWFHNDTLSNQVSSVTMSGNTYTSTLQFSPLNQSHAGTYTCRVGGNARLEANVTLNIIMVSVSITPNNGINTAGENYSLWCSVNVTSTGSTGQPTITWLDHNSAEISSSTTRTVSMVNGPAGSYSSTLTFNPLAASHTGTYTCRAAVGGVIETDVFMLVVYAINVEITRSIENGLPLTGLTDFTLRCDVSGTENLNLPTITYQWQKGNSIISDQQGQTLILSPLAASHAGHYLCIATINNSELLERHVHTSTNTQNVTIQFQIPDAMNVSHGPITPESTVTLTCTVELSLLVDIPVTVNTVWTGPAGFMTTNTAQPVTKSTTTYTSTAMVISFGREQSGNYNCAATVRATLSALLTDSAPRSEKATVSVGVYLSLKRMVYANNSVISITEIGETTTTSNTGLQCITDRRSCCQSRPNRFGEWHFPNGTPVPRQADATTFYRNRGDNGTVNLNLKSIGSTAPTGKFCCNVSDFFLQLQWTCAIIVNTIIESSGSAMAGELHTLTCLVQGINSESTSFQWTGPDGTMVSTTSTLNPVVNSSGVLRFSPLFTSHGGKYTCEAHGNGTTLVIVNLPQISSIHVTSTHTPVILIGNSPPTNISLTCTVGLPSSVDVLVNVTTVWSGPVGTVFIPRSYVPAMSLNFTMYTSTVIVEKINRGLYTCQAIVSSTSPFLAGEVNKSKEITIMPVPVNLTLFRYPPGHIRVGDSLKIFCNISIDTEASPGVSNSDINITVNWKKADQPTSDQAITLQTSSGHGVFRYSSMLSINSLTFADSERYTCIATILPHFGSFNKTEQVSTIDIQLIPIPPTVTLEEVTTTAVTIMWEQDDRDTYNGFVISYVHDGPCYVNITNEFNFTNATFRHTINNLEEFNDYTLVVYAVNRAGRSLGTTSNTKKFKTESGAPTGRPQSLQIQSSNSTSVHILWDRINCTERNGEITGYNITYYPTRYSSYSKSVHIAGTSEIERQYTAHQLTPLTNYTFLVAAVSNYNGSSLSFNASISLQTKTTSEVTYFLNGTFHANNTITDVNDIGNSDYEALLCLTNATDCCGNNHGNQGEWYLPNGVPANDSINMPFRRNRGPSVLRLLLNLNNDTSLVGVFRCEIPDSTGTSQNIYIGIYPPGVGAPTINEAPEYNYSNSQILTCTSIGGPVTTVEWLKDGQVLKDAEYEQQKRIINQTTAEYQSILSLGQSRPDEVIGNYTCRVNNSRGGDVKTIRLNGIQTTEIEDDIPLDKHLSLNCTTDLAFTIMTWLAGDGKVLENASGQYLILEINKITKAHHNANYTCQVIGPFGDQSKSVTLLVAQQSMASSAAIGGAAVAVLFILLLLVAGIVLIIIFTAKRSKNQLKLFHEPIFYKQRQVLARSGSLEDHDYTPTSTKTEKETECIELKQNEEEKDKDYYFMDTSLLAGECVKPIPVSEFSSHVERLHADRDKLFEMEYESISKHLLSSHSIADIPHNKCKNRFANIFPYDSSRVKLKEITGEDGSDYINASHLDGYNKPKAYIGAQGPMPNTVSDFWRLIWEKKLPTVVMLTRAFEGKKKCEEYWPVTVGESVQPGHGLTITLTSVLPFAEYSLRKMTLTCSTAPGSAPLKVTQFHFTGWPDHGVPQNGVTLINFIKRVRTAHPYTDSRPLLVHCSAGVGRTGAFIVLDSMLQRMKAEENLNIYEFLKQLRAQRVLMVQTQAQYNFIHDALNELILCGDTEITAPNLRIVISRLNKTKDGESGYNKQFNLIAQMSPSHSESDYIQANMECNVSKNRYPNIVPNDHFRVMLRATTVTGSDYINASFVDGYRQRGAYIATQTPMENTVNDFWRMIWDYQSKAIVMLCRMKEDGKEACYPYLPERKGDSEVYEKIKVKLVSKETTTDYIIQQLEVSEDKQHPEGHASSSVEQPLVKVSVFHYLRWPKHGTPRGTSALLELMQYITKAQMASGNKPITVMCNDGVGRTGTFICIHAQLERLKTEGVVDFFQSIKSAHIQRAGLVPEVHQYILCHNLVADYLDGFDTYANFKELV